MHFLLYSEICFISLQCLSFGLLRAKLYFKFRKNLLIQSPRSVSCRIPLRFSWKINWGLTLDHWSWKPCSFLSASTRRKTLYSLTQQERYNYQDEVSKYMTMPISDSSALTAEWKTLMFQSLLRGKKSKAYWPIFLCNLVGAMFTYLPQIQVRNKFFVHSASQDKDSLL